jgi:hypothetical protein
LISFHQCPGGVDEQSSKGMARYLLLASFSHSSIFDGAMRFLPSVDHICDMKDFAAQLAHR